MAIKILAHRANIAGPDLPRENTLAACRQALSEGFGLEIDLRRANDTRFYISHDSSSITDANSLDSFQPLFQSNPELPIAVNVKELGYEKELLRLQKENAFGHQDFYFDFELLEPRTPGNAQQLLAALAGNNPIRMASRLSDRREPLSQCLSIPASIVWADEFDSLWLTESEIKAVHQAERRLYAISPELHGFSKEERLNRWAQFKAWKIDGLCTDYALEARDFFAT